jgi:microcystin-dependent protein
MADYGTDRLSLQNTTGAIQNNSGDPLLSTDDFGATAYTFGPTLQQELFGGIANGNFASPTALVGTDEPIAEGNPLPYWTLVDNSSGRVALSVIEDAASASGYAMNVKLTDAQANDYAYLERIVPILATKDQAMTYVFAVYNTAGTAAGGISSTKLQIEAQYLQADGTTATGADGVAYGSIITTGTKFIYANTTGVAPSDAAFLRVRVGGLEQVGFTGVAETTVYEMRVETGTARTIITDNVDPNTYTFGSLVQTNGSLKINGGSVYSSISIGTSSIQISPHIPSGTVSLGGTVGFSDTANFNGGSVNIGADVNLYRSVANTLKTDDSLVVDGTLTVGGNSVVGIPAGVVEAYLGGTSAVPAGWVLANGASLGTATYPGLFAVLGYRFGGSGANFSVPNLNNGHFLVGSTSSPGTAFMTGTDDSWLNATWNHTHSTDPAAFSSTTATLNTVVAGSGVNSATSTAHTHSINVPATTSSSAGPSDARRTRVNYIIKT